MVVTVDEFGGTKCGRGCGGGPEEVTAIGLSRFGWFGHESDYSGLDEGFQG